MTLHRKPSASSAISVTSFDNFRGLATKTEAAGTIPTRRQQTKMFAVKSNEQKSFFIRVSYAAARREAVRARAKDIDFARQPTVKIAATL